MQRAAARTEAAIKIPPRRRPPECEMRGAKFGVIEDFNLELRTLHVVLFSHPHYSSRNFFKNSACAACR